MTQIMRLKRVIVAKTDPLGQFITDESWKTIAT
jgi:hypothetical protein